MSKMTDPEWLRWVAGLPQWRRQPIYESLKLNEIADRLDERIERLSWYHVLIACMLDFIQAESAGDETAMERAMEAIVNKLNLLQGNLRADPVVAVAAEVALDANKRADLATVTPRGTMTRGAIDPNVVDVDGTEETD